MSRQITFQIEGTAEYNGDVRLQALAEKLLRLRAALAEADHLVSGQARPTVEYLVSDLSHASPATIVLTPFAISDSNEDPAIVADYLVRVLTEARGGVRHQGVTDRLMQAIKDLVQGVGASFQRISIAVAGGFAVELDVSACAALDSLMRREHKAIGTVTGRVRQYNNKVEKSYFTIFPAIGNEVKCIFPTHLTALAAASVEHVASVDGELSYYDGEPWPHEILVKDIRIHKEDSELPRLSDLAGSAPEATGHQSAADFIRSLRDGW
jgi:hypothetical protein